MILRIENGTDVRICGIEVFCLASSIRKEDRVVICNIHRWQVSVFTREGNTKTRGHQRIEFAASHFMPTQRERIIKGDVHLRTLIRTGFCIICSQYSKSVNGIDIKHAHQGIRLHIHRRNLYRRRIIRPRAAQEQAAHCKNQYANK